MVEDRCVAHLTLNRKTPCIVCFCRRCKLLWTVVDGRNRRRIFISPRGKAESRYQHTQTQRQVSRRAHAHRAGHPEQCWKWYIKYFLTRSSADADNRLDAFSGQSRSTNMVPFHMLHIVSYCPIVTLSLSLFLRYSSSKNFMTLKWGQRSLKVIESDIIR